MSLLLNFMELTTTLRSRSSQYADRFVSQTTQFVLQQRTKWEGTSVWGKRRQEQSSQSKLTFFLQATKSLFSSLQTTPSAKVQLRTSNLRSGVRSNTRHSIVRLSRQESMSQRSKSQAVEPKSSFEVSTKFPSISMNVTAKQLWLAPSINSITQLATNSGVSLSTLVSSR